MTILEFINKKKQGQKISMLTCYDYTMALLLSNSQVDSILVGDSLAMVMHGHPTTLNASVSLMALHTAAVARGASKKLIIGDLPFLSYRKSLSENMNAIEKIMKAGAHAIKLEGAIGNLDLIRHVVQSGVPVMGHLGLTPQSIHMLGGFKVQGRDKLAQTNLQLQARSLEEAGCFGLVLECVPSKLAKIITTSLEIPTIGIGAGASTDGQVLVLQDMLGMNPSFKPKFLREFADLKNAISTAVNSFHQATTDGNFPSPDESYS
ncbi:MAG: 3-methyl-2-oxobutanoate hydroxymethyltransferase [Bdellovibrionaceae bacterium]|jgi:3-methyl-2-oxobutanoate hydroxymethyltransferase|nr:3-methyl-2-oxobutanoate hydroxymethyltransferase [Pseudobdellovibrionaceae bacterium]